MLHTSAQHATKVRIVEMFLACTLLLCISQSSMAQTPMLKAGDADMDLEADQLDVVMVLQAGKYLTGESATWGEGDWDGAPGGEQGNPPPGDGYFDQLDIIAAFGSSPNCFTPLAPYAAISPGGVKGDEQTSIVYDARYADTRLRFDHRLTTGTTRS